MSIVLLPFKAIGWLLTTVIATAVRTLATIATIGALIALVYWMGGHA
jgi:hypothetical protein